MTMKRATRHFSSNRETPNNRKFISKELPQTVVFRIPPAKRIVVGSYISKAEAKFYTNNCPVLDFPPILDLPEQRKGDRSYKLPKGRVLLYESSYDRFILFQSKNDYFDLLVSNKWWAKIWKTADGFFEPQYCGINHYGDEFQTKIPVLLEMLPSIIPCPREVLNFQNDGLLKLEKYLYLNRFSHQYREAVFLPLLAYIGEMLRINEGANWVVKYDKYADHYLPDIVLGGKEVCLFDSVYQFLDPESTWRPLHAVYYARGREGSY